ncbi:MAG TPA: DUF4445 domain-containing protein [Desulfobacteraceae bacterium]|nr:DUF4445 domain-containing protein [Desulfobacteraceae bacterium]HDO30657.1 DUF4445 domain-containing protein [Desulfobacteraceae bacterium]
MNKSPLVQCLVISAPAPSLEDNTADLDRLKRAAAAVLQEGGERRPLSVPCARVGPVAAAFRAAGFRGAVVVNMLPSCIEIVDFLPAMAPVLPVMALDLGTTHLEARLLDLPSGSSLAAGHSENRQIQYGADVLSRIHFATRSRDRIERDGENEGLLLLQKAVIASINDLAGELAARAGIKPAEIRALSVSGNTTMVHLFLGLNPYHICREPYIPLVNAPDPCHAVELGLDIFPQALVWILPGIGSYFGGDLISGILVSGLDQAESTGMLIDVGTNAEVVLGNRDWLIACAGAAGPALEGGVARMGMRAAPGAIEHVTIDTATWSLDYQTIDNAPAAGICGSGMIDLVAALYLARIIDIRGKFRVSPVPESAAHEYFLQQHLLREEGMTSFVVAPAAESAAGRPVILSQIDLDAVMRSKAAMYAILSTLTSQVGVEFEELERIYVAGAFGKHIDPRQAITLGMLPDLPLSTYVPVGNSSLRGAERILLSEECRRRSMEIGRKITYIELNVNQEFMIRFSGSLFIPHTDPNLFPSVPVFKEDSAGGSA